MGDGSSTETLEMGQPTTETLAEKESTDLARSWLGAAKKHYIDMLAGQSDQTRANPLAEQFKNQADGYEELLKKLQLGVKVNATKRNKLVEKCAEAEKERRQIIKENEGKAHPVDPIIHQVATIRPYDFSL